MERSLAELETIVRNRICGICSDRNVNGTCGLPEPSECALFRLFPVVAETIQATHSDDIRDYIDAIRHNVCSICEGQQSDGQCDARREVRCALDSYLLLVVEAIEEATDRTFNRTFVGPAGVVQLN